MSPPVHCRCGALLLEDVTASGVTPAGGKESVTFRRGTDYVICSECLRVYSADALRSGATPDESLVEKLERFADEDSAGTE